MTSRKIATLESMLIYRPRLDGYCCNYFLCEYNATNNVLIEVASDDTEERIWRTVV